MALIPVFYTASTKDIAEKSYEQGILKYPGICWIQDIETIVYVSSDNELHYAKGNEQIDKVIGAVSGHLPALNDDGSLVDSGKSVNDFEAAGAAASALADAKSYINKKISELINGAPETADTLKELSDLVSQNKDVITSLDTLLSKKADITAIPTTLPNPNALTFSGLVEGNYDGSEAVNIEVPQDIWIHVTIDSSGHISERDTTFEKIDNYYTSHPSNNIFMSCLIDNIEYIGTLESASPGNSYTFGVMSCPTVDATVNGITKKSITIYENDGYGIDNVILSIPSVRVSGGITFERAVCKLLARANIGYVIRPGSYDGGDYYLVIKTNFDRGRGGCLVYDRYGTFKSYRYTLMNGEEWTITPTSSPNIISITTKNGKYYSSHNFNEIKKINPENMLVCYNNAYGRLVSMDDNKAIFKILKSTVVPFDVYIRINSDDSVEVKQGIPYADLNKSDDNTYTLDLSEIFMNYDFAIIYYDDTTQSSYLGKMYKNTNDGTIFRIWLKTEIMDVTVNLSEINDDTDLSAVPVTVEKKSIVPSTLPNPNKLTFEGAVTAEYDGSGAVTVSIPEVNDAVINSSDTWSSQKIYNEIAPLKKSLEDGIQSDWNQNDDTAVNYVKNRPFYTYYVEATFNYNPDEDDNILEGFVPFKEGDNVTVKIDGIEYSKRACSMQDGGDTTIVYIGDDPSNQDSFNWSIGCVYDPLENAVIAFISKEPHSITYKKEQFHTIDPRYIPVSTRILQTDEDVFGSSIISGTRIASTRANPYPNKETLTKLSVETFNKMLNRSIRLPDFVNVEGNIASIRRSGGKIYVTWSSVGFYYQNKVGLAGANHNFFEAVICEDDANPGTIISKYGFVTISDKTIS
jgi:hypothetical protein